MHEAPPELSLKNSLVAEVLPRFFVLILGLNTVTSLVLTHVFANERKRILEDVLCIDKHYELGRFTIQSEGTFFAYLLALTQLLYESHLDVVVQHMKDITVYDIVGLALPKVVGAMFMMEYISTVAFIKQRYVRINRKLRDFLDDSMKSRQYPTDEKKFQKEIMDITYDHQYFSKAVLKMSTIYSVQLLLNVAHIYANIFVNSYVALYSMLSMSNVPSLTPLACTSVVNVLINGCALLVLVEATTQLYQEVQFH